MWGFPNVTYSAHEPVSEKIIGPNKEVLVEFPWAKLHRMINHHKVPFGLKNIFKFMNSPAINSKIALQVSINWMLAMIDLLFKNDSVCMCLS